MHQICSQNTNHPKHVMQMNSFPKMNFNSIFKYDTSSLGPASHGEQAWE
jgi:hypothetical protein